MDRAPAQNRRALGAQYEREAEAFLSSRGYLPVCRNYRCRAGEIDLIMRHGEYLVFLEVKYRATDADGSAAEAVDLRKQRRIVRAAAWYMKEHRISETQPCRFDVVAIDGKRLCIYQDAFWS